ncbi:MAG TPA: DUF2508 family protein [Syntrophomonadaceae bacterium]|nr:DUF2508 family protein [Syntrophomonadaceae bacterium]
MRISDMLNQALEYLLIKDIKKDIFMSDEEILQDAHQRLKEARNTFANVDPDFIVYAIYNLRAAEERYNLLIKQTKNK